MKINKIHKLNNGDAVSSLDKSEVIGIGPIKPGADCNIQFITVIDTNGEVLKVLLKDKRYFLNSSKYDVSASGSGWFIEILAGPPGKNGLPSGITYSNDGEKQRIVVTDAAGSMKITHSSQPEVYAPTQPSIPLPANDAPNQPNTQSTEKPTQKRGANDPRIRGYVMERLYLYEIVKLTLDEEKSDYPRDKAAELATAVHIEMSRANVKITPPSESKSRIDPQKGHNPPTPVSPEVKVPEKDPLPKKSEETEKKSSQNTSTNEGSISQYICGAAAEEWYHVEDANGNAIGVVAQDDTRRAKVLHWYFTNNLNSVSKDPKTKQVWSAIKKMVDGSSRLHQREMINEAMRMDQSKIEDLDYSDSNADRFDESIVTIINRHNDQAFNDGKTNPFVLSNVYFNIDADDRVA